MPQPDQENASESKQFFTRTRVLIGALLVSCAYLFWFFSPLSVIHGPLMYFYKYPLVWFAPLVAFLLFFIPGELVRYLKRDKNVEKEVEEPPSRWSRDSYSYYPRSRSRRASDRALDGVFGYWPRWASLVAATLALIWAVIMAPIMTGKAIYDHYGFERIESLPASGKIRVMPKEVAEQLASSGFSSPTEELAEGHIIMRDGELAWSFGQLPSGLYRKIAKNTAGSAALAGSTTERQLDLIEEKFKVSPGQMWRDSVTWQAYRRHYFTEVAETTFIFGKGGEPLILAPYISYEGFPVRVPVLGGVYVIHPDGLVEDLSPEEARERTELVRSGRLFPESLTRRIHDSYKYVNGIPNRLFTHREVLEVADTESNRQPYLMDFDEAGTKWVSTAKPHGRAFATGGIFLTDTVSGETELWRAPGEAALTGNQRALEVVRSLSIPGVVFANEGASDAGGKFRAVEPRPVFIDGRLMFLVSVVPNSANTVSKSVIVDAASNKTVARFDHDTNPEADRELLEFLSSGQIPSGAEEEAASPVTDPGEAPPSESLTDAEVEQLIEELLAENEAQAERLRQLQEQLGEGK